jgi:hypothetical protein
MRTVTKALYSIHELKELFPEGFEKAVKLHAAETYESGPAWQGEIVDSFKAVKKAVLDGRKELPDATGNLSGAGRSGGLKITSSPITACRGPDR